MTRQAAPAHDTTARKQAGMTHVIIIILCLLTAACALGFSAGCLARIRTLKTLIGKLQHGSHAEHNHKDGSTKKSVYHPYRNRNAENERLFIERLDALIAENIGRHDLNVDFLAGKMLVSRSLLFTRVKRISGKSVVEYVNDRRIAKAIELLHNDKYSLTEISELVGYSSLRYFSRVFKSVTGEQPSTFRQNLRNVKKEL